MCLLKYCSLIGFRRRNGVNNTQVDLLFLCRDMGYKVAPSLRESRLLAPSGRGARVHATWGKPDKPTQLCLRDYIHRSSTAIPLPSPPPPLSLLPSSPFFGFSDGFSGFSDGFAFSEGLSSSLRPPFWSVVAMDAADSEGAGVEPVVSPDARRFLDESCEICQCLHL